MFPVMFEYATPSVFESTRDREAVGIATNERRPVRFKGKVIREKFHLRVALRALGELIWSDETNLGFWDILDPVVTVHPDRVFFEAFSQDQGAYGLLIVDPAIFEIEGNVVHGTTNIDFTAWLWAALGEMRTRRETTFNIGGEGVEVQTGGAGGRFEKKVDVPIPWVRGFLSLQTAMAMPGTRLTVRPVDILAAIRFMRYTKARVSPRALRFELEPGCDAKLVLEPWEEAIALKGAEHHYETMRTIRTWGRRRLKLIEPLLPFATSVDIYLKGRGMPSFYAVHLPGVTFVLGLTGWTRASWTDGNGFEHLAECGGEDPQLIERAAQALKESIALGEPKLADMLGIDKASASRLLMRLCRQGRAIYDVEARRFRHRELFEKPIDEKLFFPPNRRRELADAMVAAGGVNIAECATKETRKIKNLKTPDGSVKREVIYRDWQVAGSAGDIAEAEIVVNDNGRIIFGRCQCAFFKENFLAQGPCEHMLALLTASESARVDLPSSQPSHVPTPQQLAMGTGQEEAHGGDDSDEGEEADE